MADELPDPPIPADVDLRDFPYMPLNVVQLTNSETWLMADGEQAKAAVNLWCAAWHQVPAGSLPNNERVLAALSRALDWGAVRDVALRGFTLCNDGRLYHRTIAEKAAEAWTKRWSNKGRTAAATAARLAKQAGKGRRDVPRDVERGDDVGGDARETTERTATATDRHDERDGTRNDARDDPRHVERDVPNERVEPRDVSRHVDHDDPRNEHVDEREEKGREEKESKQRSVDSSAAREGNADWPRVKAVGERVLELAGIDDTKWTGTFRDVQEWLERRADPDRHIYPTIEEVTKRRRAEDPHWTPGSLRYFSKAVYDRMLEPPDFLRRIDPSKAKGGAQAAPLAATAAEDLWRGRLADFRRSGVWLASWGPKPGDPGCDCPKAILVEETAA